MTNVTDDLRRMLEANDGAADDEPAILCGTGRGPTGRLRNYKAMNGGKLADVYAAILAEGDDPEAIDAVTKEVEAR